MTTFSKNGDYVSKTENTDRQEYQIPLFRAYRALYIQVDDGEVTTGGDDTETVSVRLVDGLEVARGTDRGDATVLAENGAVTLSVDGAAVDVDLTDGVGSTSISTNKSAGTTIDVEATDYSGGPVEGGAATIEVAA